MGDLKDNRHLAAKEIVMRPDVLDNDGILLVAENSDITEWTFHIISKNEYYITAGDGDGLRYLKLDGQTLTVTSDANEASAFAVTSGTGTNSGKICLTANGYSIVPDLKENDASKGFWGSRTATATKWLNLVIKSPFPEEDFTHYSAQKVSVSDTAKVRNGQQVVIYTRIWNDTTKKYEFYVVDHDGSLMRCYDTGDGIEWVGTKVNTALWDFTEGKNADGTPSYYYWLQNAQYGNYLVPKLANGTVSYASSEDMDFNASVNLNGRRYGENKTTIIAWDEAQYAYSGLKTENGHVVPCPLSEAEDFYFAVVNPIDLTDDLTEVATLDNNQYGITMKMIDFNNTAIGSGVNRDPVQNGFFGAHALGYDPGLLSTDLEGDYPKTRADTGHEVPLSNLFNNMTTVNHLFLQSIHNESGYFEYDSTKNFAHLNENGNFTVYDQIGQVGTKKTTNDGDFGTTRTHGQFMPYNDLVPGLYSTATNQTDVLAHELPDLDPGKGEKLYLIPPTEADYFFGMELSASFTQTASGLDAWGHDIIFEFSGDDDFWLYVDGELVLDLGGVRPAMTGSVNFRTGVVNNGGTVTTLYEVFRKNYQARGLSAAQINEKLAEIFTQNSSGQYVFKDYTNHDMRIFYMERGAGASNLHMRFNLAAVRPGTFLLSKKLSGTELHDSSLIEFPYQIYYYSMSDGESLSHLLGAESGEEDLVVYQGSARTLNSAGKYSESFTPAQGSVPYEHVFFLKPGETAEITLPEGAVRYEVVECGVNPDIYDTVSVNSTPLEGTATRNFINGTARKDYQTTRDTLENRANVEYDNHVSENALRTLSVTKKLYDTDGKTELIYPTPETTFTFRLYLGDENADPNALPPAALYPYCIKDTNGHYCRWDVGSQKFVSLGVTSYEALTQYFAANGWTDSQKEAVIFRTSPNGSISRIPAGYTVEVRNLVVSTRYKVEERDNEIPRGYTRREADGYTRISPLPVEQRRMPFTGFIASEEDRRPGHRQLAFAEGDNDPVQRKQNRSARL